MKLNLDYAAGILKVNFMLLNGLVETLINNRFDTIELNDSTTGASLKMEIADLNIESLVLLDKDSDIEII